MATYAYTTGLKEILDGTIDWVDDATIKLMLLNEIGAPNYYEYAASHLYVSEGGAHDPVDHELDLTGGGYEPGFSGSGRATLSGKSITAGSGIVTITATSPAAWTLAAGDWVRAAIIYHHETSDAASRLLFYVDFEDTQTNGGTFTLQFHASGIVTVAV